MASFTRKGRRPARSHPWRRRAQSTNSRLLQRPHECSSRAGCSAGHSSARQLPAVLGTESAPKRPSAWPGLRAGVRHARHALACCRKSPVNGRGGGFPLRRPCSTFMIYIRSLKTFGQDKDPPEVSAAQRLNDCPPRHRAAGAVGAAVGGLRGALKRDMHTLTRAETLTRLAGLRAQSLAQGSRPHQDKIDHFVVLLCVSQLGVCERGRESLIHLPIHYIHSRLGATHNLT